MNISPLFLPRRVSSATACAKGGTLRSIDSAKKRVEVQIQECKITAESLSQHAKAMQGDSARKQNI